MRCACARYRAGRVAERRGLRHCRKLFPRRKADSSRHRAWMVGDRSCLLFACFVDQPGNAARSYHQNQDDDEELGHQNKLTTKKFVGQRLNETEKDGCDHSSLHRTKSTAECDGYALDEWRKP